MIDLKDELNSVERYLQAYLSAEDAASQVRDILGDVSHSGGKRIRPRLLLLAGRYGPEYEEQRDRLCRLAALTEMVHAASLIHDDIVDDAPLRRGSPTIQARYGKDRAVYAGDLLLSRIVTHLFKDRFYRVGAMFGRAVEAMCIGELGQMKCLYDPETTISMYLRSIEGKTAALCRLACAAGAAQSGAGEDTVRQLAGFGRAFGMMFQIRDDLLDYLSDTASEGKPVHSDFPSGVLTLPVLYAARTEEGKEAVRELAEAARHGCFGQRESAELDSLVRRTGGLAEAYREMQRYAAEADGVIDLLPSCGAGEYLRQMTAAMSLDSIWENTGV